MKNSYQVIVVGGGPAGLASAISAYDNGARDVLIIERENRLGGILNQCIHNGFGLSRFKTSLTGPEYADRFIKELQTRKIDVLLATTVIALNQDKSVVLSNSKGVFRVVADAIILAMGCRERSRGALNVPGERPVGVFSAGTAQKYVNCNGYLPGKDVVILGSGDIGLIMARRMTLEGAKVHAVCEIMPYSSGLRRNIVQCLDDFNIPLYLSHTITRIDGINRVTGVEIARVDKHFLPIKGTERYIPCDTVLFSVGLIPENELVKEMGIAVSQKTRGAIVTQTRETSVPGVFSCGNVLHVHDLVDFVSEEAEIAGKHASRYALQGQCAKQLIDIHTDENIAYVVPQKLDKMVSDFVTLYFRVKRNVENCVITLLDGKNIVAQRKKRVALSAEMETIHIPAEKVATLQGELSLVMEVEK